MTIVGGGGGGVDGSNADYYFLSSKLQVIGGEDKQKGKKNPVRIFLFFLKKRGIFSFYLPLTLGLKKQNF